MGLELGRQSNENLQGVGNREQQRVGPSGVKSHWSLERVSCTLGRWWLESRMLKTDKVKGVT